MAAFDVRLLWLFSRWIAPTGLCATPTDQFHILFATLFRNSKTASATEFRCNVSAVWFFVFLGHVLFDNFLCVAPQGFGSEHKTRYQAPIVTLMRHAVTLFCRSYLPADATYKKLCLYSIPSGRQMQ